MSAIRIETKGEKIYISSPYNADFVSRIKLIGGKWDASSRRWTIKADALEAARKAMMEVYGETDEAPAAETVTLVLEFRAEMVKDQGPITIAGKTIAAAFGRDSGARVGDDVAFIAGAPESCGSAKNWSTCIPEGSVCEVYRVPRLSRKNKLCWPASRKSTSCWANKKERLRALSRRIHQQVAILIRSL